MLKSDTEVAMRAHFENFKNETDNLVNSKVDEK
jgi:hypothetical protein